MKNDIKIIKTIIIVILSILAIFLIYDIYCYMIGILKDTNYPYLFGYTTHNVIEDNMTPNINKNDLIILKKQDYYTSDDIVLFNSNGSYRIGFIKDTSKGNYIIQDNINSINEDFIITNNEIIGKEIKNIKNFAKIFNFLTSGYMIGIIFILIGLYIFATLKDIK